MPDAPGETVTTGKPAGSDDDETLAVPTVDTEPSPAPADAVTVGTSVGRYVVLDTLGSGGMGTVLRAYDPKLHREVALKRLRSRTLGVEENKRLVREAQALAQLSHPNVVAVYDVDLDADRVIVAMELVRGPPLDQWLKEPRPWRERVQLLLQAGEGLAAAHRAHLVHRDFKPGNVMITPEGLAKVMDFGLAKPAVAEESSESDVAREHARAHLPPTVELDEPMMGLTQANVVMGTPPYMAPEQHTGAPADPAADQYAFCVTLWQALTGERPFVGSMHELMEAKYDGPPRWPRSVPVPARLVEAIRRGLAPVPAERWPSMDALLVELRVLLRPRRSRWRPLGLLVGLGVAVIATVAWQARRASPCEGAREHLVGIWDEPTRAGVQQAIERAGADLAEPVWRLVSTPLDAYAEDWAGGHRAACEATTVRGEQSAAVLDLRMACLHRARAQLQASVQLLGGVDERTVLRAVDLVEHLPRLERCTDVAALLAEAPPPEDPEVRAAVERAHDRLAAAASLHRMGRFEEALEAVQRVQADAESLGHAPLTAELAAQEGLALEALARYEQAEQVLRRGAWLGIEHGATTPAVLAIATWAFVLERRLSRADEALLAAQLGLRLARRLGHPLLEARSLDRLASVHQGRGDWAQAEALYRDALVALEAAEEPEELELSTILNDLGSLLQERGRGEEALVMHRRALEIRERRLGHGHPYVGSSLTNLGNVQYILHEPEQAQASYERALAIHARAYGEDHPLTTVTRSNLGALRLETGDLDGAAAMLERVAQVHERTAGVHPETAVAHNNLGGLEQKRGNFGKARDHLQRSREILLATLGPDHPQLRSAHYNLGLLEAKLGHRELAIACFESALAVAGEATLAQVGRAKLALARALWDDPAERARARALGEEALADFEADGNAAADLEEAQTWLREHEPR